jgi:hypothetical protein
MNFILRIWNRPETAARRRRAANFGFVAGFLIGMILWGFWVFRETYFHWTYELNVVDFPSPSDNPIWFWLDGEPFVAHQSFEYEDGSGRHVILTLPLKRFTKEPALLEYGRSPNGRRRVDSPVPPGTERLRILNEGYMGYCTIFVAIAGDKVHFRTEPYSGTNVCIPADWPVDRS